MILSPHFCTTLIHGFKFFCFSLTVSFKNKTGTTLCFNMKAEKLVM